MIEKYPDSLIVGARNMKQLDVPGKSSFGNRFSNFWYRLETGIKLGDTQSGFRLYPVQRLKDVHFFTDRFEFEIEVLVRAAWQGYRIRSVPVKVYYAPEESRVSHFRPFRDFARISLLNATLVIIAFLWIMPRNMFRHFNWAKFKRLIRLQFVSRSRSSLNIGLSAGFGVFISITPIWGFQLLVGLVLAHFLKLSKGIVFVSANLSIPPMIPLILYISFITGGLFVENPMTVSLDIINRDFVKYCLYQYVIGSLVFAVAAGILTALLIWATVKIKRKVIHR
jgi:uncharacterized protein (DUF2062 family)